MASSPGRGGFFGLHFRCFEAKELAPRARFELATFRLTAEMIENLTALSGVAYEKLGAIFPSLVAPTPAPTPEADEKTLSRREQNRGWKIT
jgi:hypothetical protein